MNIEEEAAAAAKTLGATRARLSADPERSLARAIVSDLSKPADPLSWEAINAFGRVVFTPDGRPIRTIVTGRRRIVTGFYASRKAGRRQPHEGMNEQTFYMHCEVDTEVIDYRAQPFRFEFVLDGVRRIYIADCVRLLDGGQIEVVEVKNDRRALKDLDYASKLQVVREICGQLGWNFRVVTRDQMLRPAVRHANIVEVQSRRLRAKPRSTAANSSGCTASVGSSLCLAVANEVLPRTLLRHGYRSLGTLRRPSWSQAAAGWCPRRATTHGLARC